MINALGDKRYQNHLTAYSVLLHIHSLLPHVDNICTHTPKGIHSDILDLINEGHFMVCLHPHMVPRVFTSSSFQLIKPLLWTLQAMVATVNNLLQPQAQAAWKELSTGEQLRAATTLLDTVEQGAFVLADNLLKTDIVQENTDNIRECRRQPSLQRDWCFVLGRN